MGKLSYHEERGGQGGELDRRKHDRPLSVLSFLSIRPGAATNGSMKRPNPLQHAASSFGTPAGANLVDQEQPQAATQSGPGFRVARYCECEPVWRWHSQSNAPSYVPWPRIGGPSCLRDCVCVPPYAAPGAGLGCVPGPSGKRDVRANGGPGALRRSSWRSAHSKWIRGQQESKDEHEYEWGSVEARRSPAEQNRGPAALRARRLACR